ncbi:hypothetical protein PENTCL1PPCAC_8137, partial [Pristionchus entomophagus]
QKEEYKKGVEMNMERVEKMRTEFSKSVETLLNCHVRVEKERDGLIEKLKEAAEKQLEFALLVDIPKLRTNMCNFTHVKQIITSRADKELLDYTKIDAHHIRIFCSELEAEKERARFAELNGEMEQLRAVNAFLVTTRTGELYEEVMESRGRIRQLEEEVRGVNLAGPMKKEEGEEEEVKRKRTRNEEPKKEEEEMEGDIKDTLVKPSPTASDSEGSTISSSSRSSTIQEKITVARSIASRIAQAKYRTPV